MNSWSPQAEPTPPTSQSDDDWTGVTDLAARRKLQNRKSQRKHSTSPHPYSRCPVLQANLLMQVPYGASVDLL